MRLNWLAYNYRPWDGYGRYSAYMVRALRRAGVQVVPHFAGAAKAAAWLLDEWGVDLSLPTVSCLPPFYLQALPACSGPHWLLTMTEGSECPEGWAEAINKANIDRLIVPCAWNAEAFARGGVECPISVIPGGTDPDEFPLSERVPGQPYIFLALADRGKRKGWMEAYTAFFEAFGTASETGPDEVRLLIKYQNNDLLDLIRERGSGFDPRIVFVDETVAHPSEIYRMADCFVAPSRGEGWGMPHREAAMMGLPVITQAYSGMADGHTHAWAIVVEGGRLEPVDAGKDKHIAGQWRVCDGQELAATMRAAYENPHSYAKRGKQAARWLREHQTWDHSAAQLITLMEAQGFAERERVIA